jgi:cell wall-associated NlpC family hydrolase
MLFRRHEVASPPGELLLEEANRLIGTAYVRGGTDCSWYSMHCVEEVSEIRLPHRAGCAPSLGPSQLHDPSVLHISRAQLKAGDLLFHHGDATAVDHVSIYLDNKGPGGNGRVMDEEPHDTGAPAGWPTSTLGVGAQIRPMNPGYYCDWEHVVAIGRVVEINGKP